MNEQGVGEGKQRVGGVVRWSTGTTFERAGRGEEGGEAVEIRACGGALVTSKRIEIGGGQGVAAPGLESVYGRRGGLFPVGGEPLEQAPGIGDLGFDEEASDLKAESWVEAALVLGEPGGEVAGGREAEGDGLAIGASDDHWDGTLGEFGLGGDG